jgi:hypothetical protein
MTFTIKALSIIIRSHYAECDDAFSRFLITVMNVVVLRVDMPGLIMPNIVMVSVVAPKKFSSDRKPRSSTRLGNAR